MPVRSLRWSRHSPDSAALQAVEEWNSFGRATAGIPAATAPGTPRPRRCAPRCRSAGAHEDPALCVHRKCSSITAAHAAAASSSPAPHPTTTLPAGAGGGRRCRRPAANRLRQRGRRWPRGPGRPPAAPAPGGGAAGRRASGSGRPRTRGAPGPALRPAASRPAPGAADRAATPAARARRKATSPRRRARLTVQSSLPPTSGPRADSTHSILLTMGRVGAVYRAVSGPSHTGLPW